MTDRELLELAAKAAGYDIEETSVDGWTRLYFSGELESWNPLESDQDALRLAVKLQLSILPFAAETPDGDVFRHDGRIDATRRAIVRAAAEIGKGMA